MKRFSHILLIWMICFIGTLFSAYISYNEGDTNDAIAWITSSIFSASLINPNRRNKNKSTTETR
jgi:tryptophan-rich sensory protein